MTEIDKLPYLRLKDLTEFVKLELLPDAARPDWPIWPVMERKSYSVAEHTAFVAGYSQGFVAPTGRAAKVMHDRLEECDRVDTLLLDCQRRIMDDYEAKMIACLSPATPAMPTLSGKRAASFVIDDLWQSGNFAEIEKRCLAHMLVSTPAGGKTAAMSRLNANATGNRHERRSAAKKEKRRGKHHRRLQQH